MEHVLTLNDQELGDLSVVLGIQIHLSKARLKEMAEDGEPDYRRMLSEEIPRLTALRAKIEAALKELPL